jgi:tetratricopeptide (TPR) repeat protein
MKKESSIKLLFFGLILFFVFTKTEAQTREELIVKGKNIIKIGIQKNNTAKYLESRKIFEQAARENPKDSLAQYYMAYTEYLLIIFSINNGNSDFFETYYDSTVAHLNQLIKLKSLESEVKTLLAAIYMMKINKSPIEAPFLSGKINGLLNEALILDINNPRSYYLLGIMKFKTPAFFGGSIEESIKYLKKAISIYENEENVDSLKPDWGYLESLAWMGQVFKEKEQYEDAEFMYKKVLEINPDYGWVKYKLLPDLEKSKNKK